MKFVQEPVQNPAGCLPVCNETDWTASLGDIPFVQAWNLPAYQQPVDLTYLIHIGDCQVAPGVTYHVSACDPVDTNLCSVPLVIGTSPMSANSGHNYGDIVGDTTVSLEFDPPDGYTNVGDVFAWILTKKNYGTASKPQAHVTWMDLHGGSTPGDGIPPDYILSVADLSAVYVFGFKLSLPYQNTQGGLDPQNCP